MYKVFHIIQGNVNRVLGINKSIAQERIDRACSKCFASHTSEGHYTGWCQKSKGGCNCPNKSKASLINEKCPLSIWANDWISEDRLKDLNKENGFNKA